MVIDQRNAGASVTPANATVTYTLDRWFVFEDTDGACSIQQVTDAPTGFVNSLKFTTTTADSSLSASQRVFLAQRIEGFNTADLAWGTASAAPVTLSFLVKSSLTGTFGGALQNGAFNRAYPFTYTISAANTWEQKTVTIAGDTTGTWTTNNTSGIQVAFGLGVGTDNSGTAGSWAASNLQSATGAVSVIGTLNATWQATSVQLEKGSTATSFDYRPFGTELALCQRYFLGFSNPGADTNIVAISGSGVNTTTAWIAFPLPVQMRTQPSMSVSALALADGVNAVTNVSSAAVRTDVSTSRLMLVDITAASGLTQFRPYYARFQTSGSGSIQISAEL
jgi:hypothetical protein